MHLGLFLLGPPDPSLPISLSDGYLYSLGTFVCMILLFRKWIATGLMGSYVRWVLVFDVYLYTPEFMVCL